MRALGRANLLFRERMYEDAIKEYEKALHEVPELKEQIFFNISIARKKNSENHWSASECCERNFKAVSARDHKNQFRIERFDRNHPAAPYLLSQQLYTVNIIVPVYNALEEVKRCLKSLSLNDDGYKLKVIVVNDSSDQETTNWLRRFCHEDSLFVLIEHPENRGYTKAVNTGLRESQGDYVVTLNSDAIVTKGWLQSLIRCIRSDEKLGIVGPLSNAASWQNVPELLDENKQFAVNEIPLGMTSDEMAAVVRDASYHIYPRVPFVNGFCFMMSREVINAVGLLDEEAFPTGYGEENDYCMRAADAGFGLAIADDAYVYHAKSKSFGHEKRKSLSKQGSVALKEKHGKEKFNRLAEEIKLSQSLPLVRERVKARLSFLSIEESADEKDPLSKRILFLLPVSGGGGGVHSIVQETMGMRRVGVEAKIAVPNKHRHKFIRNYGDIDVVEDLFLGFEEHELVSISKYFDVIVGTIYTSMRLVKKIVEENKKIKPAYYVQDYEPLFSEPGSDAWLEARESYTLVPEAILFAKTKWLCDKVYDEHGVKVKKVFPSLDHDVYKPDPKAKEVAGLSKKIVVSAMIRPKTPRRGAERTMRFLKSLKDVMGERLHVDVFGCEEGDPLFEILERGFDHSNHGVLTRIEVAKILQRADVFLDFSDYQAFGRTGIEAMACGVVPIITKFGGVNEYVVDDKNSLMIDPFDEGSLMKASQFLFQSQFLKSYKISALLTASRHSVHKASVSEILVFCS